MARKLMEEYRQWGLVVKTESMYIEGKQEDVEAEDGVFFRNWQQCRYLGVEIIQDGSTDQNIEERNIQGRQATMMLNSSL